MISPVLITDAIYAYFADMSPEQLGAEWCKIVAIAAELFNVPIAVVEAILQVLS